MLAVQAPAQVCMTCACAHGCVPEPGPVAPVNWTCFLICQEGVSPSWASDGLHHFKLVASPLHTSVSSSELWEHD